MRQIGLALLVVGFSWLLFDAISSFSSYQHVRWICQSQNLPAGDMIPRDEAVSALRELSLNLKDHHQFILIPGFCMLAGGLLAFFAPAGLQTTMKPYRILCALLPFILTGCYLMPYPDRNLTKRDSAWGKVKRGETYVLKRDFLPRPDYSALRNSSCAGVDDVGLLPEGTAFKFTGFCVRRNICGAQPFVYAEALGGGYAGKTFAARGLVEVSTNSIKKTSVIVDIRKDLVRLPR